MDARKRKETDARWLSFMEKTSMVPFASLISGRLSFSASDIQWVAIVTGIVLYGVIYWAHAWVSGGVSLM